VTFSVKNVSEERIAAIVTATHYGPAERFWGKAKLV
jgi:hypothetical protein